jgi:hypothetical protein
MFSPDTIARNIEGYRKTAMQAILNKPNIEALKTVIKLPSTVKDSKPLIMMFIDKHPFLKNASAEAVLHNLIMYAMVHQTNTGRLLNLTMDDDPIPMGMDPRKCVEIEEEEVHEKPTPPTPSSPSKLKTIELAVDDEDEAEVEAFRRKLQVAKKKKALEEELKKLQEDLE